MWCLNCHQLKDSGRLLPCTLTASKTHLLHDIVGHFHLQKRLGMPKAILGIHTYKILCIISNTHVVHVSTYVLSILTTLTKHQNAGWD